MTPKPFQRSTPRAEGIAASGISDLVAAAEEGGLDLHSLMVARHGRVVAEGWWSPYSADVPTLAYSLSKTLTATAIAMAEHDGLLALHDPVLPHLGVDRASVAPQWSDVTIEHCLSMTVGFESESAGLVHDRVARPADTGVDWLPRVLASAPSAAPGSLFTYCQTPTYLLSRLHYSVTGQGLVETLTRHLPAVFSRGALRWAADPLGHELGYSGAHLTTEAMLALAQLHLGGGRWSGTPVMPKGWVARATSPALPPTRRPEGPDWSAGYGFSLWLQRSGYRGDGAYGQLALVVPGADLVVAVTAETARPQALLDLVHTHLLPAVNRPGSVASDLALARHLSDRELPVMTSVSQPADDPDDVARLACSSLSTLPRSWHSVATQPDPAALPADHLVDRNPTTLLTLHRGEDSATIAVTPERWSASLLRLGGRTLPVAATGAWLDATTYAADVVLTQTPHRFRVTAHLDTGLVDLCWRLPSLTGLDPLDVSGTLTQEDQPT